MRQAVYSFIKKYVCIYIVRFYVGGIRGDKMHKPLMSTHMNPGKNEKEEGLEVDAEVEPRNGFRASNSC